MDSMQIFLCLCILPLRSAVGKPEFGRRDKRNLNMRQYLEQVVTGMNYIEQQLVEQQNAMQLLAERHRQDAELLAIQTAIQNTALQLRNAEVTNQIAELANQTQQLFRLNDQLVVKNALQLLSERYAELVLKDQELLEQNANLERQNEDLANQTANQNAALEQRNSELTNQIEQLTNQTQELFRLNAINTKREEDVVKQNAELAIQTANQSAALQQRNTELTNQIEQLTNQTQQLFRLNAVNTKREETLVKQNAELAIQTANQIAALQAFVKQNAELTARLAQFGVDLNQSRELQNTISRTIVTQSAQMHNFSLQNDQFQNSLRENIAEMRQNSKNQSTMLGRRLEQISTDSQQNLSRTEEVLSEKLNSTEVLLREYTTNQVNQLTQHISSSADLAKQELTARTRHIHEKLDFLEAQSERGRTVTFYEGLNYRSLYPAEFEFNGGLYCVGSECCRNLDFLNDNSESLRTRNLCVEVFVDKNCTGQSRNFARYSSIPDLGDLRNKISSVRFCW